MELILDYPVDVHMTVLTFLVFAFLSLQWRQQDGRAWAERSGSSVLLYTCLTWSWFLISTAAEAAYKEPWQSGLFLDFPAHANHWLL